MKLPWLKFYPSDWLSDEALRGCSPAARGLWVDLICLMAKSKKHGYLLAGDKPMGAEHIARIFGESLERTSELLVELAQSGVYSIEQDTIFSRRMVKDERGRKSNRDKVLRWRNHHVTNMKPICNQDVTPQRLEARGQRLDIKRERAQVRPTLAQWADYARQIGWQGKDVQGAFDHYEANGWRVGGKAPVKDWQAAARNCFRRSQTTPQKGTTQMQPKPQIKSSCESAPLYRVMGYKSYADWSLAGCPS
jgi:hypothetical protein